MGNEGFVSLETNGAFQWVLFCSLSNPFEELRVEQGAAIVMDGYDGEWMIPLDEPERFTIRHLET